MSSLSGGPTSSRTFDSKRTQTVTSKQDPIYADFSLPELRNLRGPQLQAQALEKPALLASAPDKQDREQWNDEHYMPPKRMVTGAQINPGWVDDFDAMNAKHRKMVMPQGSTQTGNVNDTDWDLTKGYTNPGGYNPFGLSPSEQNQDSYYKNSLAKR